MGNRTHVSKAEYQGIVKEIADDEQRSKREKQVEKAHDQDLPGLLEMLHRKNDGNASAILREVNKRLDGSSVSRPTLYNWLDKYGIRD